MTDRLTIGELAARSGVSPSALRYYEKMGLIHAERTTGNQRRYARSMLRRIAFVRAAQRVGLSLNEARQALAELPRDHAPNARQWDAVARTWQRHVDSRIAELERIRARLTSCIGCGCLSLRRCGLYNPSDSAGANGPGARYLGDDEPAPAA